MADLYRQKESFPEQSMGDDLMIFDAHTDKVHVLNKTSAFIYKCCGEGLDIELLEKQLSEVFDMSAVQDVPGVIRRSLLQLMEKGLIEKV